ncbi:disease resistance protein At4g27190-like [Prosopis cineraria]|uniref:disease resistance protein At4g27190-like n=1 Tax=Prosopis cineraria TaxID=364024 RepID=UPI0024102B21|nr:disease resistance protein At4g27190-like [Prosopis cineraria]
MQTIVDGRYSRSEDIFPRLLLLSVSYMKNLRSICEGEIHSSHCFGMLKSLTLHNCPKLSTIFTLNFISNLSLLKVLAVKGCPKVSALISCGSSKLKAGTFLSKLRTMILIHLPELISISNGLHMGPSLENIGIYDCPKLQSFSKMELSSKNLKIIKGETKWWEALTWSEAEWGKIGQPSMFDSIFSPINQEADIISQLDFNDDIDDSTGGMVDEPLQASSERVFKGTKLNANRPTPLQLGSRKSVMNSGKTHIPRPPVLIHSHKSSGPAKNIDTNPLEVFHSRGSSGACPVEQPLLWTTLATTH